jgi:hypothetical protein
MFASVWFARQSNRTRRKQCLEFRVFRCYLIVGLLGLLHNFDWRYLHLSYHVIRTTFFVLPVSLLHPLRDQHVFFVTCLAGTSHNALICQRDKCGVTGCFQDHDCSVHRVTFPFFTLHIGAFSPSWNYHSPRFRHHVCRSWLAVELLHNFVSI